MSFLEERERLDKKYQDIKDEVSSYSSSLYCYSTFDRETILKVLTNIVSEIEGIVFEYLPFYKNLDKSVIFESGLYDRKEHKYLFSVTQLKELRKAITVGDSKEFNTDLHFYSIRCGSVDFEICPDFSGFEYLKEFIDEVISYRFKNKMEKISSEELERLKNQFLLRKLGEKRDKLINQIEGVSKKLISPDNDNK